MAFRAPVTFRLPERIFRCTLLRPDRPEQLTNIPAMA
jgi:hypothetical protein